MKKDVWIFCSLFMISFVYSALIPQSLRDLNSPSGAAEKLTRQLNLTTDGTTQGKQESESFVNAPKLVEKLFKFPNVADSSSSVEQLGHHAGYYNIQDSYAARMFYFFFESRNKADDPVVIWLTGGPGCGSELALFYENGPFTIARNLSLIWNDYGWDKASNLIYVDQPTGTGFSYSSDERDLRKNEEGVSNDLYDFLQAFFTEHPEYGKNDFYITGESYAGHYIPGFATRINQGNKEKEGIHINLKGFAIGNGLTNPAIQYKAYADYALEMGIIQESDHKSITKMIPECEQTIEQCECNGESYCINSKIVCGAIFGEIIYIAGDVNYYDIRKKCEGRPFCYDFSKFVTFLNQKSVRDALGVGDIKFYSCNHTVYDAMEGDWMKNLELGIPTLLKDGIKSLIYAGEYDLICNWLGNSRWVDSMEWYEQKEFVEQKPVPFLVDGVEAGIMKSHGPLTFLKVHNAGHLVPMDQPKAALEMLKRWTRGTLSEVASETQDMVSNA